MYAISAVIEVKPEHVEKYKAACLAHANNTKTNEAGCLDFSVFQSDTRPEVFYLHELYVNKQAVVEVHNHAPYLAAHKERTKDLVVSKDIRTWESVE